MADKNTLNRRKFVELGAVAAAGAAIAPRGTAPNADDSAQAPGFPGPDFLIKPSELTLKFSYPAGARRLSFVNNSRMDSEIWRERCKFKLIQLLNFEQPKSCPVRELRRTEREGIVFKALIMQVSDNLSIPAYLLVPAKDARPGLAVMARFLVLFSGSVSRGAGGVLTA